MLSSKVIMNNLKINIFKKAPALYAIKVSERHGARRICNTIENNSIELDFRNKHTHRNK